MDTFKLEIISPSKLLLKEEVTEVIMPGQTGNLGVLKNHAPLLTALKKGDIRVKIGQEEKKLSIEGGFAEIDEKGVTILVK